MKSPTRPGCRTVKKKRLTAGGGIRYNAMEREYTVFLYVFPTRKEGVEYAEQVNSVLCDIVLVDNIIIQI